MNNMNNGYINHVLMYIPVNKVTFYDECICFCHIYYIVFFMVGDNLLKNGLFYFRDPTHHNWVSKNIQKGQRGEQNSTIIIIANNLIA